MADCKEPAGAVSLPARASSTPRLPVTIVDHYATTQPNRPFAFSPLTNNPADGFEPITFGSLARAVDHVAHEIAVLRAQAQATKDEFPTIAYIGPNDVRYQILILACVKAHCKAFFASPRNSDAAIQSLFANARPLALIHAEDFTDLAHAWSSLFPVDTLQAPPANVWLQAKAKPFPYNEEWEEARWHPYYTVHTSGSTGIPKLVVVRQGTFGAFDLWSRQPDLQGAPFIWRHWADCSTRILLFMPLFHMAALAHMTAMGIYEAVPFVFGPPSRPLTSSIAVECMRAARVDSAVLAPSMTQDIAASPGGVELLAELKLLGYGGGPLAPAVGDMLAKRGVKLCNVISSTECFPYHVYYQSDPELWNWHIIDTASMGAEMREVESAVEGMTVQEMVIKRKGDDPGLQTLFYTFPEKTEWTTGDLFKKHPTLPHHYQYLGRSDDIIVFSNGLKINPTVVEKIVAGQPGVGVAMVVGNGRFQAALIVEPQVPAQSREEEEALIESLWPIIEEANQGSPAYGKIVRHLVAVSDPHIPLPRSAKGSLQRTLANEKYKSFIEEMYDKAAQPAEELEAEAEPLDLKSVEALTDCIIESLVTHLGVSRAASDIDLFSIGVDSLQVINLSRHLLGRARAAGLAVDKELVAPRIIYAHMTPRALAEHLFSTLRGGEQDDKSDDDDRETEALARLVEKYTSHLPSPNRTQRDPLDDQQTIIVTGTTGSLGAYLLDRLIHDLSVSSIIALNRGSDGGASRQPAISAARGLSTDFSRVLFLGADLSLPSWGLTKQTYDGLLASADRIVHNAWPVNFNIGVESFEPSIRGVRHLVDFCNQSAKRVPIIFVSSVSTATNWSQEDPIPEGPLDELTLPSMGYGRSKAAASRILDAAAARSGVCTASIRVGLIAGSRGRSGMWNKQEFLPSLVASSVYLGVLPDSIGCGDTIDWMLIEDVAGMILDVAGITQPRPVSEISGYFHSVNPQTTTWSSISAAVKEFYGSRISRVVSLSEWIDALEKSATDSGTADAQRNPGIKLIDAYKGLLEEQRSGMLRRSFATARTEAQSSTMRNLEAVNGDLMKLWCRQWDY